MNVSDIVCVVGNNKKAFPWREQSGMGYFYTSGIVLTYNDKKYVIVPRKDIIQCDNLFCIEHSATHMYESEMQVAFSLPEYDVAILVSHDQDQYYPGMHAKILHDIDLDAYLPKQHLVIVEYDGDTYNHICVPYHNMVQVSQEHLYMPTSRYIIAKIDENTCNMYGAALCSSENIIGMVIDEPLDDDTVVAVPIDILYLIIKKYVSYSLSHDVNAAVTEHLVLAHLPFSYDVNDDVVVLKTHSDLEDIKQGDVIVAIDDSFVSIIDNLAYVHDPATQNHEQIDNYIRLHYNAGASVTMTVSRLGQNVTLNVVMNDSTEMLYSNSPYFKSGPIPYMDLKNIIITELTHELLDIMNKNGIDIRNEMIDIFYRTGHVDRNILLIVDCIDPEKASKLNLPCIESFRDQIMICPCVKSIDNMSYDNVRDFYDRANLDIVESIQLL